MFEALAPPKDSRWLGKIEGNMVNPMPVLVSGPKLGGPGYPTRTIGKESGYESEFNHDRVESLNRQYKLGYGPGFRTNIGEGKKGKPAKWNTTRVQPGVFDSEGTVYKKSVKQENTVSQQHVARYMSRAAALAARTNHASPFISSTSERKLPTEVRCATSPHGSICSLFLHRQSRIIPLFVVLLLTRARSIGWRCFRTTNLCHVYHRVPSSCPPPL